MIVNIWKTNLFSQESSRWEVKPLLDSSWDSELGWELAEWQSLEGCDEQCRVWLEACS